MGSVPPLLTFLLMVISGWLHRRQLILIEFLQAENRLLKERLQGKRVSGEFVIKREWGTEIIHGNAVSRHNDQAQRE